MAVFNEPTKWQTSLVNSGDANVIPQSTPVGTGEASFDDGFPQITQIPVGAGGIAPDRKDFNGLFKILGDWIFFNQNGGVSTYSENFDYVAGRVVLYNGNLYKCIQSNGVSSTVVAPDSDTAYWQRLDSSGAITGEIKWFAFNTAPDGYLVCNGANVSRETYADLFAAIGTTFGSGDGSTTFTLPNLINKFAQGSTTVGTVKSAGLPNITGSAKQAMVGNLGNAGGNVSVYEHSGALTKGDGYTAQNAYSLAQQNWDIYPLAFDASLSNSIYGNSSTVQPPALTLLPCIKY